MRRYFVADDGLSRAQVTRLIALPTAHGAGEGGGRTSGPSSPRATPPRDVALLAYVDKAHGNLSGPATRRILEREYSDYGQAAYVRLASISVAHLYRLRNSEAYRKRNTSYQPTRPTPIPIGERRKPQPRGEPGISAHRHRASGRSRWTQRAVSHQCRRRSDAVGDCGRDPADLRTLADSGAGSVAGTVPVRDPRLSFRQRQRVHQLQRGAVCWTNC